MGQSHVAIWVIWWELWATTLQKKMSIKYAKRLTHRKWYLLISTSLRVQFLEEFYNWTWKNSNLPFHCENIIVYNRVLLPVSVAFIAPCSLDISIVLKKKGNLSKKRLPSRWDRAVWCYCFLPHSFYPRCHRASFAGRQSYWPKLFSKIRKFIEKTSNEQNTMKWLKILKN